MPPQANRANHQGLVPTPPPPPMGGTVTLTQASKAPKNHHCAVQSLARPGGGGRPDIREGITRGAGAVAVTVVVVMAGIAAHGGMCRCVPTCPRVQARASGTGDAAATHIQCLWRGLSGRKAASTWQSDRRALQCSRNTAEERHLAAMAIASLFRGHCMRVAGRKAIHHHSTSDCGAEPMQVWPMVDLCTVIKGLLSVCPPPPPVGRGMRAKRMAPYLSFSHSFHFCILNVILSQRKAFLGLGGGWFCLGRWVCQVSPPPPPRGSVDTTKTHSGPQRVRMSSAERPIGAAKGKQSDTEALCPTPPLLLLVGGLVDATRHRWRNRNGGPKQRLWRTFHFRKGKGSEVAIGQWAPPAADRETNPDVMPSPPPPFWVKEPPDLCSHVPLSGCDPVAVGVWRC